MAGRGERFRHGDFLLVRDPEALLTGAAGHAAVCRVNLQSKQDIEGAHYGRSVAVRVLASGERMRVSPEYVRRIDSAELMRDIDTAPLDGGDVSGLESAAVAWLRQQAGGR